MENQEFKIGDRIIIVKNFYTNNGYSFGKTGTITAIYEEDPRYEFTEDGYGFLCNIHKSLFRKLTPLELTLT